MDTSPVNDTLIDALTVVWDDAYPLPGARIADTPPELRVVRDIATHARSDTFIYFVRAVRNQKGVGVNGSGIRYPTDELDFDEEPLAGVELYDPLDEILISEGAFDRLMARLFATVREGALCHQAPILQRPWWEEFVTLSHEVEARAYGPQGAPLSD